MSGWLATELGVCRSCESPILWVRSAVKGLPMPLDREPVADGNVRLERGGAAHVFADADSAKADARGLYADRYRSHHSTCPKASAHRRRERSA
jgi:hypothetical protein